MEAAPAPQRPRQKALEGKEEMLHGALIPPPPDRAAPGGVVSLSLSSSSGKREPRGDSRSRPSPPPPPAACGLPYGSPFSISPSGNSRGMELSDWEPGLEKGQRAGILAVLEA